MPVKGFECPFHSHMLQSVWQCECNNFGLALPGFEYSTFRIYEGDGLSPRRRSGIVVFVAYQKFIKRCKICINVTYVIYM